MTPPPVRAAAVVVTLEGLAALVVGIVALVAEGAATFAVWGFVVLLGAAVAAAGIALLRGVRGARGPAVVAQLVVLGVAYYAAVPSGRPAPGILLALVAAAVLAGLLSRAGREWFGE